MINTDKWLVKIEITEEQVENKLKNLRNKKSPGPDTLKNELYRKLKNDKITLSTLTDCYRVIVEGQSPPADWKQSVTVMIPKQKKPMVDQLRPLALTNVSYKVFMSLVKDTLENHISFNDMSKENQAGFTKGGRVPDNLFILKELIEYGYRNNLPTVIIAVDFKKAYDSIIRGRIIEILKDYWVQKELLDFIEEIYKGDYAKIKIS